MIKRAKIQIDVEATTEGAVRGLDRVADATERSKRAVERNDVALKAMRLELDVAAARAANLKTRLDAFAEAETRAADSMRKKGQAAQQFSEQGNSMVGVLLRGARAAGPYGAAIAAGGAAMAGAAMVASSFASETLRVTNMFANLPFSIEPAKTATRGLADDMTLAKNAIMAHQAGVATTAAEYAQLVDWAQTLAMKMGRDVNDTVERVTLGIAKQEREILDELVILPRMEEMWRQYATTLGKTTNQLTDHEKTVAFTRSAMDALARATQGVDVDMDGLAGTIARTTVEARNLRTELLGGGSRVTTLAEGVRSLDAAMLRNVATMGRRGYGESFRQVSDALREAGVAVDKYRGNNDQLEAAIRKVLEAEKRQLTTLALRGELTEEHIAAIERLRSVKGTLSEVDERILHRELKRIDNANEVERRAARAAEQQVRQREARLLEIEEQLVFGRAAKIDQEQLNALVAEEAELRAQVAELQGKGTEAADLRRRAFLDDLERAGEGAARGRSSKRPREIDQSAHEAAKFHQAQWEQFQRLADARRRRQLEIEAEYDPTSPENLERQLANVIDFEARRAEIVLAARRREIEQQAADREAQRAGAIAFGDELRAGLGLVGDVDATIADLERQTEAQIEAVLVAQRATQARLDREIQLATAQGDERQVAELRAERELEMLAAQGQAEELYHELSLARLEERRAAEERAHEARRAIMVESSELAIGAAQAIVEAAVIQEGGLRAAIASTAKAEAMRHGLVLGPSELIRAAISAAAYDYSGAAQHTANAAQSFAFAGVMAGIAGAAGAWSTRRGSAATGWAAGNFGEGEGTSTSARSEPRSGSGDMGGPTPLSLDTRRNVSATASTATGGPVVVHQSNHYQVLGSIDDRAAATIARAQADAARRQGRLVAGGAR